MSALRVVLQLGNLKFDSQLSSVMEEGQWTVTLKKSLKIYQLDGILREGIVKAMQIFSLRKEVMAKLDPINAKDRCEALPK